MKRYRYGNEAEFVLDGYPVRGHTCAGLVALQSRGKQDSHSPFSGCEPTILCDGRIRGCDDEQKVPFEFCPMCGEKLPEPFERIDLFKLDE